MSKVIMPRAMTVHGSRRPIDFYYNRVDRQVAALSWTGCLNAKTIARTVGLNSASQIYNRNRKLGIRVRDIRNGKSPFTAFIIGRILPRIEEAMDDHIQRTNNEPCFEDPLKFPKTAALRRVVQTIDAHPLPKKLLAAA